MTMGGEGTAYGERGFVCIPCSDGRHVACLEDKGYGGQCTCPCENGIVYKTEKTDVGRLEDGN